MIHLKHNQVVYKLICRSFSWCHLETKNIRPTMVFYLVSLAQMDATRQEPVVDRHNKQYLDQKGGNG